MPSSMLETVAQLLTFSPRQGENEQATARYLEQLLAEQNIPCVRQDFETTIPTNQSAQLIADGQPIPAETSSFVSGEVKGKHNLISSLISTQPFIDQPNINFNPACRNLSLSNHYFAPSVAVKRSDMAAIINAEQVSATVSVNKLTYQSCNLLVGNTTDPRFIVIAHYDSIKMGATDNASGVAVLADLMVNNRELLDSTLFTLSGNEELSYDFPIYWGHGFRAFEDEYSAQLNQADRIIVVDCVGNGPVIIDQDPKTMSLAFPIKRIKELAGKIWLVSGDIDKLLTVYHSDDDTIDQLDENYLQQTSDAIKAIIKDEE